MTTMSQTNYIPSITYTPSKMSVNIIDAEVSEIHNSYIQLPSVKQYAAKLKPSAVNEKEQEIASIIKTVYQLESEHVSYIEQFITRGNQALYALLSKVYALAVQINHSDNCDSILKNMRSELSLRKKIKTQKNTTAMTMIVRWVVGGSRQAAHTYSKALDAAYKDNLAAEDLAAYFTKCGGINNAVKQNNKQLGEKQNVRQSGFSNFMRTADTCFQSFENTDIVWTEEIFGESYSLNTLILAHNSGGGVLKGQRAFNLNADSYNKICKILADQMFKDKNDADIVSWVESEREQQHKITSAKRDSNQNT